MYFDAGEMKNRATQAGPRELANELAQKVRETDAKTGGFGDCLVTLSVMAAAANYG